MRECKERCHLRCLPAIMAPSLPLPGPIQQVPIAATCLLHIKVAGRLGIHPQSQIRLAQIYLAYVPAY